MAIPRKGSRPIVVDGVPYRWYVRKKATYSQLVSAVEQVSRPGEGSISRLTVAVEQENVQGSIGLPRAHPDVSWLGLPLVPVTPSQVAHYIAQAVEKGWQPTKKVEPFFVEG